MQTPKFSPCAAPRPRRAKRRHGETLPRRSFWRSKNGCQFENLARELQCPIIALSQLSRSVEQRNPPIPILSDLRESGSIEQDADTVLMLYRDDAYNEDSAEPGTTDVYIRKNRNGPTGRVGLHFDHARMSFSDASPPHGT